MQTIERYIPSKTLRVILYTLATIFAVLFIFGIGAQFGARHARFTFRPEPLSMPGFGHFGFGGAPEFPHLMRPGDGHGFVGQISSVALPTITAVSHDGATSTILLTNSTIVRGARGNESSTTLSHGDMIVVLGEPHSSSTDEIDARFIRILPPPSPQPAQN